MAELEKEARLRFWCQKMLPAVYDDSLSYYEQLCKVVAFLNGMVENYNAMVDATNQNTEDIEKLGHELEMLLQSYSDFLSGKVPQSYIEGISKWLDQNLQCVVNRTVKFFSFGVDDNGHVYVDMPNTWRWLKISWDMNYGTDTFGHIELNW